MVTIKSYLYFVQYYYSLLLLLLVRATTLLWLYCLWQWSTGYSITIKKLLSIITIQKSTVYIYSTITILLYRLLLKCKCVYLFASLFCESTCWLLYSLVLLLLLLYYSTHVLCLSDCAWRGNNCANQRWIEELQFKTTLLLQYINY